jgi:Mg2+/citrate symporter
MNWVIEIFMILVPPSIVGVVVYYVIKKMLEENELKRLWEYRKENQKVITPLRLQAYERLTIFLERISIPNLIVRLNVPGMTAGRLHRDMIKAINAEYDHNLSQQIYVSKDAWIVVKNAKENTLKFINLVAKRIDPNTSSMELIKALTDEVMNSKATASEVALDFIKKEVRRLF